jgi:hypothetical protein
MAAQLYSDIIVAPLSMEALRQQLSSNTLNQPNIIGPIMNGSMLGMFTVGSTSDSDARIEIDGTNQRILVYDENGDARVLIGYDPGGF